MQKLVACSLASVLVAGQMLTPVAAHASGADDVPTRSPIKHFVVIFQENVSFDHYFGTYPNALNPAGEPQFTALPGTPTVNGLTPFLLTRNPNLHYHDQWSRRVEPLPAEHGLKPRPPTRTTITPPSRKHSTAA